MVLRQTVNLADIRSNRVSGANTKDKGLIGELEAFLYFSNLGYIVSRPISDNHPYDFIVDTGSQLLRVQVKSRTSDKDGLLKFELKSCMRGYSKDYCDTQVDLFFLYDLTTRRKAIVGFKEIGKRKSLWLTLDKSFSDYEVF